ncbi:hypothetical protein ACIP6P_04930 [Streptomyces sp. NPDC088729]|uniref:hypothetical protein n=1 Tax=Streptomyces sp. NPDC088729 TaxID=3365876 RepID=UPI00381CDD91
MEQSIDSNKKPEFAAGLDPAFIPGLTPPPAALAKDGSPPERKPGPEPEDAVPAEAEAADAPEPSGSGAEPDAPVQDGAEEGGGEGPVFEVADRRGSIRVDRAGVRFRLDDQEAEFRWDEIGAVEVAPARFGRRFTVTVHLSTRRWFNAEVEAATRAELKGWPAELDAVLDAYFEES